ncbi:ATP-binding protein [Streptomyces sp. NPDC057557]|uniref:ATP-binding protein n=1 Tax=Streptomyces sp. NPDC057557 TaxID=3346167 RepID=UPI0036BC4AD9
MEPNETMTLIAAELAANAVRHGRVPGRDFHLRLTETGGRTLRIEVTDTRTERFTPAGVPQCPAVDEESGRGLLLVSRTAGVPCRAPEPRASTSGRRSAWTPERPEAASSRGGPTHRGDAPALRPRCSVGAGRARQEIRSGTRNYAGRLSDGVLAAAPGNER